MHRPAPTRALACGMQPTSRQSSPAQYFFSIPFSGATSTSLHQDDLSPRRSTAPYRSVPHSSHASASSRRGRGASTQFFLPPIEFWTLLAVSAKTACRSAKPLRSSCFWRDRWASLSLYLAGPPSRNRAGVESLPPGDISAGASHFGFVSHFLGQWGLWREHERPP